MKALAGVSGKHLKLPALPRKHAEDLHLERRAMSSHAWNASRLHQGVRKKKKKFNNIRGIGGDFSPTGKCT